MHIDMDETIRSERDRWLKSGTGGVSSVDDINNGHCRAFAKSVKDTLRHRLDERPPIRIREYGYESRGYTSHAHVWIEYDGRHYDAECPSGVSSPEKLPIFQRGGVDPR